MRELYERAERCAEEKRTKRNNTISSILKALSQEIYNHPELRVGQLISNAARNGG